MALSTSRFHRSSATPGRLSRSLTVAAVVAALGWSGMLLAANSSMQGAKKEDAGFDGDAPTSCARPPA
jgi:serine-type D-Ala-D-Ala carboxypeptidase (penicillin-binding protein 5/6)